MKKIVKNVLLCAMSLSLVTSGVAFAGGVDNDYATTTENLTTKDPTADSDGISTRDLGRPSTTWNVANSSYTFSGSAVRSTLYTNYLLKGKKNYTISCYNYASKKLKAKARTGSFPYTTISTLEVSANAKKHSFSLSRSKTSDTFYIEFPAPSDCYGTVK